MGQTFGAMILELRETWQVNDTELAARIGMSRTNVFDWTVNKVDASPDSWKTIRLGSAKAVADAYQISLDELYLRITQDAEFSSISEYLQWFFDVWGVQWRPSSAFNFFFEDLDELMLAELGENWEPGQGMVLILEVLDVIQGSRRRLSIEALQYLATYAQIKNDSESPTLEYLKAINNRAIEKS